MIKSLLLHAASVAGTACVCVPATVAVQHHRHAIHRSAAKPHSHHRVHTAPCTPTPVAAPRLPVDLGALYDQIDRAARALGDNGGGDTINNDYSPNIILNPYIPWAPAGPTAPTGYTPIYPTGPGPIWVVPLPPPVVTPPPPPSVPEPSTWAFLMLGFAAVGVVARQRVLKGRANAQ